MERTATLPHSHHSVLGYRVPMQYKSCICENPVKVIDFKGQKREISASLSNKNNTNNPSRKPFSKFFFHCYLVNLSMSFLSLRNSVFLGKCVCVWNIAKSLYNSIPFYSWWHCSVERKLYSSTSYVPKQPEGILKPEKHVKLRGK